MYREADARGSQHGIEAPEAGHFVALELQSMPDPLECM
jgi:hypothetical protein